MLDYNIASINLTDTVTRPINQGLSHSGSSCFLSMFSICNYPVSRPYSVHAFRRYGYRYAQCLSVHRRCMRLLFEGEKKTVTVPNPNSNIDAHSRTCTRSGHAQPSSHSCPGQGKRRRPGSSRDRPGRSGFSGLRPAWSGGRRITFFICPSATQRGCGTSG